LSLPRFRWSEPNPVAVPAGFLAAIAGPELLAQALIRRGQRHAASARAFLDPGLYSPTPPWELPDIHPAVQRLLQALQQRERICVWGDFDVDGQTATAILVSAMRSLRAEVSFYIPVRAEETHGLSTTGVQRELAAGARLMITCDTGSSDLEAIAYARRRGLDVIVTDHHELPPSRPPALALVSSRLLPGAHPLRELTGAGVAYKLAEALLQAAGSSLAASSYLDLAALGLVADLAVQRADVRYLTQRGLASLQRGERPGLAALMQVAGLEPGRLSEEDISFSLAPRLNAVGRLADASLGVELLLTPDEGRARALASRLDALNNERQLLCQQVFQAAQAQIEREPALLEPPVLILAHPAWPASVIGIVASRLVQRYGRPAVLIANPPGQLARGSARSLPGCDIVSAIAATAASERGLLANHGGHPMAAGFSLPAENLEAFKRALIAAVKPAEPPTLALDAYLPLTNLTMELVSELGRLAPFGPGNPAPAFVSRGLVLASHSGLGRHEEHRQVIVSDAAGNHHRVLWWQGADWPLPSGPFDLAYSARLSDFRGERQLQVEWLDARPAVPDKLDLARAPVRYRVVDCRRDDQAAARLASLCRSQVAQVWSEGPASLPPGVVGRSRHELQPAEVLAIWTVPPGEEELRTVLEAVSPREVYLFANDPGMDEGRAFLQRLAGLLRYVLQQRGGQVRLVELAAATAQRPAAVLAGLEWMAGKGMVAFTRQGESLTMRAGGTPDAGRQEAAQARLTALLSEVAASRAYYRRAASEALLP